MEAVEYGSSHRTLKYEHTFIGETITGCKGQLQALGLGIGLQFPGEEGGPRRALRTVDPRGFPACIERAVSADDCYTAWIHFPGMRYDPHPAREISPGLKLTHNRCFDLFEGTAELLVQAGKVPREHLPGAPGMRKTRVTVFADGSVANEPHRKGHDKDVAYKVARFSKSKFGVYVMVSRDEEERRREESKGAFSEWQERIRAMPRPIPLRSRSLLSLVAGSRTESAGRADGGAGATESPTPSAEALEFVTRMRILTQAIADRARRMDPVAATRFIDEEVRRIMAPVLEHPGPADLALHRMAKYLAAMTRKQMHS